MERSSLSWEAEPTGADHKPGVQRNKRKMMKRLGDPALAEKCTRFPLPSLPLTLSFLYSLSLFLSVILSLSLSLSLSISVSLSLSLFLSFSLSLSLFLSLPSSSYKSSHTYRDQLFRIVEPKSMSGIYSERWQCENGICKGGEHGDIGGGKLRMGYEWGGGKWVWEEEETGQSKARRAERGNRGNITYRKGASPAPLPQSFLLFHQDSVWHLLGTFSKVHTHGTCREFDKHIYIYSPCVHEGWQAQQSDCELAHSARAQTTLIALVYYWRW